MSAAAAAAASSRVILSAVLLMTATMALPPESEIRNSKTAPVGMSCTLALGGATSAPSLCRRRNQRREGCHDRS